MQWIEEEIPAEDEKAGEGSEAPSPDTKSEAGSLDVASASDTSDTSSGTLPSDEPASGAETDAKARLILTLDLHCALFSTACLQ